MSGREVKRQLLVCRRASSPWRALELTRPGERIHEAIDRLRDGDLVAIRPLDECRRRDVAP